MSAALSLVHVVDIRAGGREGRDEHCRCGPLDIFVWEVAGRERGEMSAAVQYVSPVRCLVVVLLHLAAPSRVFAYSRIGWRRHALKTYIYPAASRAVPRTPQGDFEVVPSMRRRWRDGGPRPRCRL
eukprot:5287167-Prymnesium_polylepis.2